MAIHVSDPETDSIVRESARRFGVSLEAAVKLAVINELRSDAEDTAEREADKPPG